MSKLMIDTDLLTELVVDKYSKTEIYSLITRVPLVPIKRGSLTVHRSRYQRLYVTDLINYFDKINKNKRGNSGKMFELRTVLIKKLKELNVDLIKE